MHVRDFADTLGRRAMADKLAVGGTAVNNAIYRGHFPASWYVLIAAMAAEAGVDCPISLFAMKGVSPSAAPLSEASE